MVYVCPLIENRYVFVSTHSWLVLAGMVLASMKVMLSTSVDIETVANKNFLLWEWHTEPLSRCHAMVSELPHHTEDREEVVGRWVAAVDWCSVTWLKCRATSFPTHCTQLATQIQLTPCATQCSSTPSPPLSHFGLCAVHISLAQS